MKIWISKNSEVPVREQIITQITLGITSGDLPVGEKLPSTQEIARRFQIHPNTVSNAYRILAEQSWIEFKTGSGFFVAEVSPQNTAGKMGLDGLIADFLNKARAAGFSKRRIENRLKEWFSSEKPTKIMVIDSDHGLRSIMVEEIRQATFLDVVGQSIEQFAELHQKTSAFLVAMNDEKPKIQSVLPPEKNCFYLNSRSVSEAMVGQQRPLAEDLIAVVSGWDDFLLMAKTMLLAAKIESETLILRSTNEKNWQKGLEQAAMIICDLLAAKKVPEHQNIRVFKLIADDSLEELINLTS